MLSVFLASCVWKNFARLFSFWATLLCLAGCSLSDRSENGKVMIAWRILFCWLLLYLVQSLAGRQTSSLRNWPENVQIILFGATLSPLFASDIPPQYFAHFMLKTGMYVKFATVFCFQLWSFFSSKFENLSSSATKLKTNAKKNVICAQKYSLLIETKARFFSQIWSQFAVNKCALISMLILHAVLPFFRNKLFMRSKGKDN